MLKTKLFEDVTDKQLLDLMDKAIALGGYVRVLIDTNGKINAEYTGIDEMGPVFLD